MYYATKIMLMSSLWIKWKKPKKISKISQFDRGIKGCVIIKLYEF